MGRGCFIAGRISRRPILPERESSPSPSAHWPIFSRFNVMALSTMICDGFCSPLSLLGGTVTRNKGAAIRVAVTGKTVTVEVSSN